MSGAVFAYHNKFQYQERFPDFVLQYDGNSYTDYTDEAQSVFPGDITAVGISTNHILFVGFKDQPVNHLRFVLHTPASGGSRQWSIFTDAGSIVINPYMIRGDESFKTTTDYICEGVWQLIVGSDLKGTVAGRRAYWYAISVISATNSPVFSQISARTIVASSDELVLPAFSVGTNSPSDVWRTRSQTVEIVPGRNDKLNYNNGGNLTITLTPGVYRPAQLASHIETLLGAGYTVNFDPITGYTLTKSSGTFQLLCATGANKSVSVFSTLGFDCSSNKTGALTYRSGYLRNSTGGTILIDSTNKTFSFDDGSGHTATYTEGWYSIASFQSMAKAACDTAASVTDCEWGYDEETNIFSFKRAGANTSITGGTSLDVVGMAVEGSAAIHYGDTRIHTQEYVYFISHTDLEAATFTPRITDLFAFNHNLTSDATVISEEYSLGAFGNSRTWTVDADSGRMYVKSADLVTPLHNSTVIRLTITDKENPDGYVQCGLIGGFDGTVNGDGYFEVARNIKEQPSESSDIFQDQNTSSTGTIHTISIGKRDRFNYQLYAINNTDKENIKAMQDEIGIGLPFLFIPNRNLTAAEIIEQMIWGRLAEPLEHNEVDKAGLLQEISNLTIIEFK